MRENEQNPPQGPVFWQLSATVWVNPADMRVITHRPRDLVITVMYRDGWMKEYTGDERLALLRYLGMEGA
jgi:hypothetical protein